MNLDEIKLFKSELKILPVLERQYQIAVQDIAYIEYQMQGVRGLDPSKEPSHSEFVEMKNILIPIKDIKVKRAEEYKARIDRCYRTLDLCDETLRSYLVQIYVEGKPTYEVAEKHYISESSLRRFIISELLNVMTDK